MNHDSLALVFTLGVAAIVVAIVFTTLIIEVGDLIRKHTNHCKHETRYFDGDSMTIRCCRCNKIITSITNEMTLEEFINQ